ncbi:MAG: cation:proton antiporter [Candidatus Diapherotrites archaeon]|nr:cation:proton antiporter [Candidatus Diapherotrites archaeon]
MGLLGPVLGLVSESTINLFRALSPFFATLALIMLLFEGGLHLNFYKIMREFSKATFFTLLNFALTVLFSTAILLFFKWDLLSAIFLSVAVGGTSSTVIIPLIRNSKAKEKTKTILSLESAITDPLCVIFALAVLQFMVSDVVNVQIIFKNLASAFSVATVIGFITGLIWLRILDKFEEAREFGYLVTTAVVFLLYAITEIIGGNGAFSTFVFGIVLGNGARITKMLRMKELVLDTEIVKFQAELSMFIKTFFFVYIGMIFSFVNLSYRVLLITALLLLVGIVLPRFISSEFLARYIDSTARDKRMLRFMMARGLASAVLITYSLNLGIQNQFLLKAEVIAFLIILLTNLITSIGFYVSEHH